MKDLRLFLAGAAFALMTLAPQAFAAPNGATYDHVLMISIDGMHAVDLTNYIRSHSKSTLAGLAANGLRYPNALTTAPSDSFPGLLAPTTGGTSKSTGVFYDDSYDRSLFAPSSMGGDCSGPPGAETVYAENLDKSLADATGGGTLGDPLSQIDPTQLPLALESGKCVPVLPHQFIKVNTIFEVIRAHGGRTAWADKHPAYEILNGPSGEGVQDLYTPEVNSNDPVTKQDTTTGYCSIQRNDVLKVQAVLNEINGLDSTGTSKVGVPTIFGMNFQAVSVGQKLAHANANDKFVNTPGSLPPLYPVNLLVLPPPGGVSCSDSSLVGGYSDSGGPPNTGLQYGLDFVDTELGFMVAALQKAKLDKGTLVIIEAKHGQSPIDVTLRQMVSDKPYNETPGLGSKTTDDVALLWLTPQTQQSSYRAAKAYLASPLVAGPLGIVTLLDKSALAPLYGNPFGNNRTPDFIAITTPGLIYTGGTKLAEHGGFASDDRNVALLVSNPSISAATINDDVETRQIAATILDVLGINPKELAGVRQENSKVLPGL